MSDSRRVAHRVVGVSILSLIVIALACAHAQDAPQPKGDQRQGQRQQMADAVQDFQSPRAAPATRPEQQLTDHDQSEVFKATSAPPDSPAMKDQPKEGKITGFDFYRDPLNADKAMTTFEQVMAQDVAERPKVNDAQRKLLESRYILDVKTDPNVKMSRGKPIPVGPTARLKQGLTFDKLASMPADEVKK